MGTGGTGVWQLRTGDPAAGGASAFARHPAYAKRSELPGKVNDLHVDTNGTLWVATDEGVLELGASERRFGPTDGLPSAVANVVRVDTQGTLWVGTRHGLARSGADEGGHFVVPEGLADEDVTALLEDRSHNLWVGTRDGALRRVSRGSVSEDSQVVTAPNGGVFALTESRDGAIWVGTGRGLERYRDGAFLTLGRAEGLPNQQILNVLVRRTGEIWVVDGTGALQAYDEGQWSTVSPAGTIEGDGMLGMSETPDGSVWVGGASLHRYLRGQWQSFSHAGGEVTVVVPDGTGLLLAQTTGEGTSTLWRFSEGTFDQIGADIPLVHVQRLLRARDGKLWISTGGGGLVRLSDSGARVFHTTDGLPHDVVYGVVEDLRGICGWRPAGDLPASGMSMS